MVAYVMQSLIQEFVNMKEQQQPSTDKDILRKGVAKLMLCLPFMFIGPILIYIAAGSERPVFTLIPGIAFCILAVLFLFQGINGILDSMFKTDKKR